MNDKIQVKKCVVLFAKWIFWAAPLCLGEICRTQNFSGGEHAGGGRVRPASWVDCSLQACLTLSSSSSSSSSEDEMLQVDISATDHSGSDWHANGPFNWLSWCVIRLFDSMVNKWAPDWLQPPCLLFCCLSLKGLTGSNVSSTNKDKNVKQLLSSLPGHSPFWG